MVPMFLRITMALSLGSTKIPASHFGSTKLQSEEIWTRHAFLLIQFTGSLVLERWVSYIFLHCQGASHDEVAGWQAAMKESEGPRCYHVSWWLPAAAAGAATVTEIPTGPGKCHHWLQLGFKNSWWKVAPASFTGPHQRRVTTCHPIASWESWWPWFPCMKQSSSHFAHLCAFWVEMIPNLWKRLFLLITWWKLDLAI